MANIAPALRSKNRSPVRKLHATPKPLFLFARSFGSRDLTELLQLSMHYAGHEKESFDSLSFDIEDPL